FARPLKLPAFPTGGRCPVTPVASASPGVGDPRGHGPFYLGGPMPKGLYPWNKMVYVITGAAPSGPIIFRGGRIDGSARLQFSADSQYQIEPGIPMKSDGGVTAIFYDDAVHDGASGTLYVFPATKGCYAIQVDAPTFEDVIVVTAN